METSEQASSASGLQMVGFMMRAAVAIVAMLSLAGCGVGADEAYDGQTLVGSSGQALMAGPPVEPGGLPQPPVTAAPSPLRNPGTVALPQDPIPVYEGRAASPVPPPTDPTVGGTPRPGLY